MGEPPDFKRLEMISISKALYDQRIAAAREEGEAAEREAWRSDIVKCASDCDPPCRVCSVFLDERGNPKET